jgi:uncharacterized protein (DUF433 family)
MPRLDASAEQTAAARPTGFFAAEDGALVAGVPVARFRAWVRSRMIEPSIARAPIAVYSFQDVAQALVVRELEDRGVGAREIARAVSALRPRYGRWPLLSAELFTEHLPPRVIRRGHQAENPGTTSERTSLALREDGAFLELNRGGFEQAFEERAREPLQNMVDVLKRGGWPSRERHLTNIEIDPERLGGRPTIRGRRIEVELVAELARSHDRSDLRDGYDLTDAEIEDAVAWWSAAEALSLAA